MKKNKKEINKNCATSAQNTSKYVKNSEAVRLTDGIYYLNITVKPNAKQSRLYWDDELLRVDIQSPPDKSKANQELIKLVASTLKCSTSQIQLIAGQTSRDKVLSVNGISLQMNEVKSCLGGKK